jgi:hypothetical protein
MALWRLTITPLHAKVSKLGEETPCQIRKWSLTHYKKIVLFEKNFCATGKSEAIACARMLVIPVNKVVNPKEQSEKNGGLRRRRGTGVTDHTKNIFFLRSGGVAESHSRPDEADQVVIILVVEPLGSI